MTRGSAPTRARHPFPALFAALAVVASLGAGCGDATPTPTPLPPATATSVAAPTISPSATTAVAIVPTPTPTRPPTPTAGPTPTRTPPAFARLQVYTNINFVRGVATLDGRTYAATEGGVVAWDVATRKVARRWTTADGLTHNLATSVVVCAVPETRVVVGTEKGLNLYDPKANAWQSLTPANSKMSGEAVAALVCDAASGTLVIGYDSGGLDFYAAGTGAWRHVGQREGLASDYVNAIAMSPDGKDVWVASPFGASLVSGQTVKIYDRRTTKLASDGVSGIAVDAAGDVWWGMIEGVVRFSKGTFKLISDATVAKFPFGIITAIAPVSDGSLWMGSGFGDLCHLDAAARCLPFAGMPGAPAGLNSLAVDAKGVVYASFDGAGFSAYDGKAWKQYLGTDERLGSNRITALAQDSTGVVWVGTDNGVNRGKPGPSGVAWELVRAAERGLPENGITALCARPKGGMWVAAGAPALYSNGGWTVLTANQGLLQEAVTAIAVDAQDRAWFGTPAGISMWDGKRITNFARAQGLPDEQIQALLADGVTMWIGTPSGLVRYDGKDWRTFTDKSGGLPSANVTAIARGADGTLLVGTSGGLARFDGAQATVVREVAADLVTGIGVGKNGNVWVATLQGAYRFDGKAWRHVTTADGLPTDRLMAVLVDAAGSVWLGGDGAGVANLTP